MTAEQKNDLFDYLKTSLNVSSNWIYRKEIAAWSSVVLYFTALYGLFRVIKDLQMNLALAIIIACMVGLFALLFILFLWKQYGALVEGMAKVQAFSIWMVKLIENDDEVDHFDFTITRNDTVPASIRHTVNNRYSAIRTMKVCWKLILPLKLLQRFFGFSARKYDNLEVQEAILYDMIILSCLLLMSYTLLGFFK